MNQTEKTAGAFRLRFEKCGPIRFISHLDLTRAFHRAFSRAGIPLKFSEGFSPHPKFSLALPLSVGTESLTELADFTVKEDFVTSPESLKEALSPQMPSGVRILSITPQEGKFSEIAYASYSITLPRLSPSLIFRAEKALEGDVVIQKKNKKGKWVEKNITEGISSVTFLPEGEGTRLLATLSVSAENYLKPELVLEAIRNKVEEADLTEKRILRTGVFRQDLTPFSMD